MPNTTIKLIDLVSEIKGNKKITETKIKRVTNAISKVISELLLNKEEINFTPFVRLGFGVVKDRIVNSSVTKEKIHIPQHIKFKPIFYAKFKDFLNKESV